MKTALTFFLFSLPFLLRSQDKPEPKYYSVPDFGKAGPYSHAVEANGFLYVSGTIPVDYETGIADTADITAATHRVFKNIKKIVEYCGADIKNAVKVNIYLEDMSDFSTMNEVYKTFFHENYPSRSTVGVKSLPLNMPIEIEMIIFKSNEN